MKKSLTCVIVVLAYVGLAPRGYAQSVQYVRVCSLYGADFLYIPGTAICHNDITGDSREQTVYGTWRSLWPYPEGQWVATPALACPQGRLVNLGAFQSTDFTGPTLPGNKEQTPPVSVPTQPGEFLSNVIMSGGFYDPRLPVRSGTNSGQGLCVRSIDPDVFEGPNLINPPYGDGGLPIGCVANDRIVNMPAAYSVSATAAYPEIDALFVDAVQDVGGPYTYGDELVVTTDLGPIGNFPLALTYTDTTSGSPVTKPMAGTLSVSVCIGPGPAPI